MSTSTSNRVSTLEPPAKDTQAAPPAKTTPAKPVARRLPSEPVATIEPSKPWKALNLRDIWHYRELLYFLTWRDVKVRYKQTAFGVVWVIMQPLITTIIFTIFLGKLVRVPSDGMPYLLFVLTGQLPWTFFAAALIGSSNSLVGSSHLITKVYFPRMIIPAAAICARVIDFIISFAILGGLFLYYGVTPSWKLMLWLPALVALVTLLALGVGMWASAVNVKYRDVGIALPVFVQLWMFTSPVVYPSSMVYASGAAPIWLRLYTLNPMVGIIDNFRAVLLGGPFNRGGLVTSVVITLIVLVYAAYEFRRTEKHFADII